MKLTRVHFNSPPPPKKKVRLLTLSAFHLAKQLMPSNMIYLSERKPYIKKSVVKNALSLSLLNIQSDSCS